MKIRHATIADIPDLAEVHTGAWNETYVGIIPAEIMASRTVAVRIAQKQAAFANPHPNSLRLCVEDDDGVIAGFMESGETSKTDSPAPYAVFGLYLLNRIKRRGVGKKFMAIAARHALELGHTAMQVEAASENLPACAFYAALGAEIFDVSRCSLISDDIPSQIFVYRSLRTLSAANPDWT